MIPDTFSGLAAEFNATAQNYLSGETVTTPMLLAKYTALFNYKAPDDSEKIGLTRTLLDCGLKQLQKAAQPPRSGDRYTPGEINYAVFAHRSVTAILDRLGAPDSIVTVPRVAAENLADAALGLLRKAEGLQWGQFGSNDRETYRDNLTSLANLALEHAAKFNIEQAPPTAAIAQDITASKPLVLRKQGAAPK